jgi:hypothetical protein
MGEPVGLATGVDAEAADDAEVATGAEALAVDGALAEAADVGLAFAAGDEELAVGVFDFDELQPATTSAVTDRTAIEKTGTGRQKRAACNRLCETIESLHEGWVGMFGSGAWLDRRFSEDRDGTLCNRLCNRLR